MKIIRTRATVLTSTQQSLSVHLTLHVDEIENVVIAADVIGVADEDDFKLPTYLEWQQTHSQTT